MLRRYSSLSSGVRNPVKRKRNFTSYTDEDQFSLNIAIRKASLSVIYFPKAFFDGLVFQGAYILEAVCINIIM